jgi:hypothetical protein
MAYFPKEVFTNILSYCDDTIEKKQRKAKDNTMDELMGLVIDTYIFGSNYDDYNERLNLWSFDEYLLKEYGNYRFKININNDTYEVGAIWLVRCFHGDTIDLDFDEWVHYSNHLYY